jgi:hypothetical protein
VVTAQISDLETSGFVPMQSGGADITIPAAKATPMIPAVGRFLRLVAASAEGAQRDFVVMASTINIGT